MRLLRQMALVALVIGTSVAAAATERVTVPLVLATSVAWAFVPVIQLLTGLWLVRGAAHGRRLSALERYFATHRPWSLWILAMHALLLAWPAARGFAFFLLPLGVVPAVLTVRSLRRVCLELGVSPRAASRTVAIHQVMTWLIVAAYAFWASAYLPRFVGMLS